MKPIYWVVIGLGLVIIALILFDKDPDPVDLKPYETEIAILKADRQEEQARFKEIIQKSNVRSVKDSIALNAKDKRIAALEKRASQERTPEVDTIIRNSPALESFVNTQSEIIQEQKEAIDTLKASVEFHKQVEKDLIRSSEEIQATFEKQLKATEEIAEVYKQEARRAKRGNRWLKAVIPIVGVGMFLLGQ